MADSIREQIIANLITTLQTITVGNGYEITVRKVRRLSSSPWRETDFPAVQIEGIVESKIDGSPMGRSESVMGVDLVVYDKHRSLLIQRMNSVAADIEKALHVDINRNTLATDTKIVGNQLVIAEEETNPYGAMLINVQVNYRHIWGDPYTKG